MESTQSRIELLEELLEDSVNGIEWYKDAHPESWSEADEEHLVKCREALGQNTQD